MLQHLPDTKLQSYGTSAGEQPGECLNLAAGAWPWPGASALHPRRLAVRADLLGVIQPRFMMGALLYCSYPHHA